MDDAIPVEIPARDQPIALLTGIVIASLLSAAVAVFRYAQTGFATNYSAPATIIFIANILLAAFFRRLLLQVRENPDSLTISRDGITILRLGFSSFYAWNTLGNIRAVHRTWFGSKGVNYTVWEAEIERENSKKALIIPDRHFLDGLDIIIDTLRSAKSGGAVSHFAPSTSLDYEKIVGNRPTDDVVNMGSWSVRLLLLGAALTILSPLAVLK